MKRVSFLIALGLVLVAFGSPSSAQAGRPASCGPSGTKTEWSTSTVRVYLGKRFQYRKYACSTKYGRSFRLEPGADFEEEASEGFSFDGRYLMYRRNAVGGAQEYEIGPALLDMKTGNTTRTLNGIMTGPIFDEPLPFRCEWTRCVSGSSLIDGPRQSLVRILHWSATPPWQLEREPSISGADIWVYCTNARFSRLEYRMIGANLTGTEGKHAYRRGDFVHWRQNGKRRSARIACSPTKANSCVPRTGRTLWYQYGVRVYVRDGKRFACSLRFRKQIRLEHARLDSSWFSEFHTNGRFLFYARRFIGPVGSTESLGRMLDLKTGDSSRALGSKATDVAAVPKCAQVGIDCYRELVAAAIGPGRSFVAAFQMTIRNRYPSRPEYWIERHCFGPGLATETVEQIASLSSSDEADSLRSDRGRAARWRSGNEFKSAPFC